ncbi:C-terminal binding protein CtBP [Acrasis kona]|uniref:C-terminal binding protein CtBP n=1 Tax=Acrasis kona TaxID=1008807 RepID=A0AAW2YHR8_9EUKA
MYKVAMLGKFDGDLSIEKSILGVDSIDIIEMQQGDWPELIMKQYDGFLAWHDLYISKEHLESIKEKLKGIVRLGVGFDNIDYQRAAELKIQVSNVPDYGTSEVADSAICHMLNLLRKNHELGYKLKGDNPTYVTPTAMRQEYRIHRVAGKTLGIIGLGRIGTATALRAKAFEMQVQYYDPYIKPGQAKALGIVQKDSLEELLSTSDVISLHCFLDDSNKHMINIDNIYKIKKGAYIVNTARGPLIEENALASALLDGHLLGAALDVQEVEPYEGHLKHVPNLILTPHCAFYSEEAFEEMRIKAAQELLRILKGEKPKYKIN